MKLSVLIGAFVLVAGCASTSQIDQANVKIGELESRIARMEKDLYRVEIKSAPKQAEEPKFVPAKEVEQSVIDTKIDAFLKEHLGVAFGDPIEKFPKRVFKWEEATRYLTVKKQFGYLDKAIGVFENGKLYSIKFFADIDMKYSEASVKSRINQTLADMSVSFGLASDAFIRRGMLRRSASVRSSYILSTYRSTHDGFRRLGAVITDDRLYKSLHENTSAQGEVLPEKK